MKALVHLQMASGCVRRYSRSQAASTSAAALLLLAALALEPQPSLCTRRMAASTPAPSTAPPMPTLRLYRGTATASAAKSAANATTEALGAVQVQLKPGDPWATTCSPTWYSGGVGSSGDFVSALPRLACRELGLPWRKARYASYLSIPGAGDMPKAGGFLQANLSWPDPPVTSERPYALDFASMDEWRDAINNDDYADEQVQGSPSGCPKDWYAPLVVLCTDAPMAKPALRLTPYGSLTGRGQGLMQVQVERLKGWVHNTFTYMRCPSSAGGISLPTDTYFPSMYPTVVCRQLGLPFTGARAAWVRAQSALPGGDLEFGDYIPQCTGPEPNLSYCRFEPQLVEPFKYSSGANKAAAQGCINELYYLGVKCQDAPAGWYPWTSSLYSAPPIPPSPPPQPKPPAGTPPRVRLVGGSQDWGQVQVAVTVNTTVKGVTKLQQAWAPVCNSKDYDDVTEIVMPAFDFTFQALAAVTCRSLGRPWTGAVKLQYTKPDLSVGRPYLPKVACVGNERTIADCPGVRNVSLAKQAGCPWDEGPFGPYGVACRDGPTGPGSILAYALVGANGTTDTNEGIVRTGTYHILYYDSGLLWGSVCRDGFDDNAAKVLCRSLGKPYKQARALDPWSKPSLQAAYYAAHFASGSPFQLHLDDFRCSGNEARLEECARQTWGPADEYPTDDCVAGWDAAAVSCQ